MAVMENSIEDHLSRSYHHGTEPLHIPKKFSQCVSNHPLTGRMRGGKNASSSIRYQTNPIALLKQTATNMLGICQAKATIA